MQVVLDIDQLPIIRAYGVKQGSLMIAAVARQYLLASVKHNRMIIRACEKLGHPLPDLYEMFAKKKLRYAPEDSPPGVEEFASIRRILIKGQADCDDIAPARCAQLLERGEDADLRVQWRFSPTGTDFHVLNRRGNGDIEDSSRLLGM